MPYAEALRGLQDRAEPMPLAGVERVILEETGCRHTDLFADLDPEPVASASSTASSTRAC